MVDFINPIERLTSGEFSNLERRGLKLGEEFGELQKAILIYTAKEGNDPENLIEEAIDTIIMAVDILLTDDLYNPVSSKYDYIQEMFNLKLRKWEKQINNNQDITIKR